jgi:hypothetical protein
MAPKSADTLTPNTGTLHLPKSPKSPSPSLPGKVRKPGVEWNYAEEVDDGRDEALESFEDNDVPKMGDAVEKRSPSGGQVIDLLDIARPAKPKGEGDFLTLA